MILAGDVPSTTRLPSGCRFHTRCPYAFDRCRREEPQLAEVAPGHQVACHLREGPHAGVHEVTLTGVSQASH
jgi:oligopeptide/dipeptide ABC transporter ATP-binding protein